MGLAFRFQDPPTEHGRGGSKRNLSREAGAVKNQRILCNNNQKYQPRGTTSATKRANNTKTWIKPQDPSRTIQLGAMTVIVGA